MITKDEIQELLHSTETYRVERTTSTGGMDKFQEAICAFANDLPNSRKNGYLILGANDDGTMSGLKVTDDLLKNQNFVQSNWAGHKDVIQIRYGRQSLLAVKLRAVFKKSYAYLFA